MKIVVQRVSSARVVVDDVVVGQIGRGLMILLGVEIGDREEDIHWGARKTAELRIFEDAQEKMNRGVLEVGGQALVVSQFTLCADIEKGRRPSFVNAAPPDVAERLYGIFVESLRQMGVPTETGTFAAKMSVSLVNEGPVTILIERPLTSISA